MSEVARQDYSSKKTIQKLWGQIYSYYLPKSGGRLTGSLDLEGNLTVGTPESKAVATFIGPMVVTGNEYSGKSGLRINGGGLKVDAGGATITGDISVTGNVNVSGGIAAYGICDLTTM